MKALRVPTNVFLAILLVLIVVYPWLAESRWGANLFLLSIVLIMVGGILEMENSPRWRIPALLFAIPTGVAAVVSMGSQEKSHPALFALQAATFGLLTINLVIFALRSGAVSNHKISAILSGYLMMGFTFSAVYGLLESLVPGSFLLDEEFAAGSFDLFYFSFVTLTTLGYGDIVPVTDQARALALFEAVCGTLFLVVLVSRLVSGLDAPERSRPAESANGD